MLTKRTPQQCIECAGRRSSFDPVVLSDAMRIVQNVQQNGVDALRGYARRFDDLSDDAPLVIHRAQLREALTSLPGGQRSVLERIADRIQQFAEAQRRCISELRMDVAGGWCGHAVAPVQSAGCYAPGGRYPLPSSVLMTAIPARVAGVRDVWVASPRPTQSTLAAAAIAGADGLLACGGAHAVSALAYGIDGVPTCDVVCGPGNQWITAGKFAVSASVRIDMLAGPSEIVIVADRTAKPDWIAADLLAQAEHDPQALPVVITLEDDLAAPVQRELSRQIEALPTAATARQALANGCIVNVRTLDEAAALVTRLAPEHLQLCIADAESHFNRFQAAGAIFLGERSAEALGDYGFGPNHTLPTGGTARSHSGLSVMTFLRMPTVIAASDTEEWRSFAADAAALARMEGLEAHARSIEARASTRVTA